MNWFFFLASQTKGTKWSHRIPQTTGWALRVNMSKTLDWYHKLSLWYCIHFLICLQSLHLVKIFHLSLYNTYARIKTPNCIFLHSSFFWLESGWIQIISQEHWVWGGKTPWMWSQSIAFHHAHIHWHIRSLLGAIYHRQAACQNVFGKWEEPGEIRGNAYELIGSTCDTTQTRTQTSTTQTRTHLPQCNNQLFVYFEIVTCI